MGREICDLGYEDLSLFEAMSYKFYDEFVEEWGRVVTAGDEVANINLARCNSKITVVFILLLALVVGLLNQTPIYQKLNALPKNRSEMDSIKEIKVFLKRQNIIAAQIQIAPILRVTRDVLANALRLHISLMGMIVSPWASVVHTRKITMTEIYFEVVCPFVGNVTAQLYYYDTPITDPQFILINQTGKNAYQGHTKVQCSTNFCRFSEVCWVNSTLNTLFNYPATVPQSFPADFVGFKLPMRQTSGTFMTPFTKKLNCSYRNGTHVIIRAPAVQKSPAKAFLRFHDAISKMLSTENVHKIHVHDPLHAFERIPLMSDWFRNLELLQNDSVFCMEQAILWTGALEGDGIQDHFGEGAVETDTIVYLKSEIVISNIENVIETLRLHCKDCGVLEIDTESERQDSIAQKIATAKVVFGVHSDAFVNAVAAQSTTLVIDIVPPGMDCSQWLFDLANLTKTRLVPLAASGPTVSCANKYKCRNSCSGVSEVVVDTAQIAALFGQT